MPFQNYVSQTYEANFYRKLYSQAFQNNWIYKFWIHISQVKNSSLIYTSGSTVIIKHTQINISKICKLEVVLNSFIYHCDFWFAQTRSLAILF